MASTPRPFGANRSVIVYRTHATDAIASIYCPVTAGHSDLTTVHYVHKIRSVRSQIAHQCAVVTLTCLLTRLSYARLAAAWVSCTGTVRAPRRPVTFCKKKVGKGSPYSITERMVPELIPVHCSQPAGDVSHKPGGRLPITFRQACSYPPPAGPQPLRGLLLILLLGERRHDGCEQFA